MKKIELLSPAGNFECLKAAIHNGADAVYLSGKNFGARAYATNFTNEEMVSAIKYCHLYGVKIYVTVNTLIKEDEVNECLEYITFLHKSGVDAVIMQDLGMIHLVHQVLPNLEIHASTQCHTTCDESANFLKSIGCKRVVLAREMTIDEIKDLKSDVEKEIFIHGALCISYSGQCLMSSMILNRSGNRGQCAGMCRLPYEAYNESNKLETEGKYIFSPKEFCTIEKLNEILKLNVDSLKIEGRMKSPIYVGYVTRLYRKYIDAYYENQKIKVSEDEIKILKVLYNREFTYGHLFKETNIINSKTPNHIGYKIGIVKRITNKIKILLIEDVEQGDAIKFINNNLGMYLNFIYNEEGKLINKAKKGDIIYVDNKVDLTELDDVYITYDKTLENIITKIKKIPIKFSVKALIDRNLELTIEDDLNNHVTLIGNKVDKANNSPTTKDVIEEKLNKINDTPFKIEEINFNIDNNIFLPMSEINNMRRALVNKLIEQRTSIKKDIIIKKYNKSNKVEHQNVKEIRIIEKEENYQNNPNIYFYTETKEIYNKYKQNNNIYYILPRISEHINYDNENLVINNTSDLYKYYKSNNIHSGIYMNVYNCYTIDLLKKYNVSIIALSPELKETDLQAFETYNNISFYAYGKLELMLIKQNVFTQPVSAALIKDRNNQKYKYYRKHNYYVLENPKKEFHNKIMGNLIRIKEE